MQKLELYVNILNWIENIRRMQCILRKGQSFSGGDRLYPQNSAFSKFCSMVKPALAHFCSQDKGEVAKFTVLDRPWLHLFDDVVFWMALQDISKLRRREMIKGKSFSSPSHLFLSLGEPDLRLLGR